MLQILDSNEISKIHRMVHSFLIQNNMKYIVAEDVSQEIYTRIISKGTGKYNIRWLIIDILREILGSNRTQSKKARNKFENPHRICPVSENIFKSLRYESISNLDFDKFVAGLIDIDRAVIILRYKWGLNLKEIGECFGKTEAWAWLHIDTVQKRIRKKFK